jgi:hypothetical protein
MQGQSLIFNLKSLKKSTVSGYKVAKFKSKADTIPSDSW